MRWSSAAAFFDLSDRLKAATDSGFGVGFPMLLCHDPADQVTPFAGSQLLFDRARTDPAQKVLVRLDGGLHDLIGNESEAVAKHISNWADGAAAWASSY